MTVWVKFYEKDFSDVDQWGELYNMKSYCGLQGVGCLDQTADNQPVVKYGGAIALPTGSKVRFEIKDSGKIPPNSRGIVGFGVKFIKGNETIKFSDENGNTYDNIFFIVSINNGGSQSVVVNKDYYLYIEGLKFWVIDVATNQNIGPYTLEEEPERIIFGTWAELNSGSGMVCAVIRYIRGEYTNQYVQMMETFNKFMSMFMSFMPIMMFIPLIGSLFSSLATKEKGEK